MALVSTLLSVASLAVSLYMLLCGVRIIMTWMPQHAGNPSASFIARLTDPFLNRFRGLKFLRFGNFDFSPLAAFALLSALSRGLSVAAHGRLGLGSILSIVLAVVASPVAFLLNLFAILVLLRIIAYLAKWNSLHPVWRTIDAIINPLLFRIKGFIYPKRIVSYTQGLITGLLVLVGLRVVLSVVTGLLHLLFNSLPI